MQDRAGEILQAWNIRQIGNVADAGRHHDMARMHLAGFAVGQTQHDRPASVLLVVGAAGEFRACPKIEFHVLGIGLEPAGDLVLGNVARPVRRKRHVGEVVDMHLVVQGQGMIAAPPIVPDARFAIDDERVDIQLCQPCGDGQPGMPPADHEHRRIPLGIGDGG